jgi:acetyl-CoA carboxylase alpha subunit
VFACVHAVVEAQLRDLLGQPVEALVEARYEKFRRLGRLDRDFLEAPAP